MARKHLLANIGVQPTKPAESAEKGESRVEYARRGASRSMMQSLDDLAENSMRVLEGDVVVSLDPETLDPSPYQDRIGEDLAKLRGPIPQQVLIAQRWSLRRLKAEAERN